MPNTRTPQTKCWCFTINNYTEENVLHLQQLNDQQGVCYLIFGKEIAGTGTPHLQGYIELSRRSRMASVKRILACQQVHLEPRRGTQEEAIEYCKKEGDFYEYGAVINTSRTRCSLDQARAILDNGGSMQDVAEACFTTFIQYRQGLQAYLDLKVKPRDFRTQVVWFWGQTGSGKSRRAREESNALCNGDVVWLADTTLKWFEPYRSNKGVVIDDFPGESPITQLLRLFDRYPLLVPVKGGFVQWIPRIVWITSNKPPDWMYGSDFQWEALLRRIDEITEIN